MEGRQDLQVKVSQGVDDNQVEKYNFPDLTKGSYLLNSKRHLRIWFSADENVFLNPENQLRLVKLRVDNPTDTILFVYDKRLLSEFAQKELHHFCLRHNIQAINLEELKSDLANDQEKELMGYIDEEIRRSKDKSGGNLGAASDILRLLSVIHKMDCVYSDFDTKINTTGMPDRIAVESPIILNLGSFIMPSNTSDMENTTICNDILAVPRPNQASPHFNRLQQEQNQKINLIQQEILQNYRQRNVNFKDIRYKYINSLDLFSMIGGNQDELKEITGEDVFGVRKLLQHIFSTNANYIMFGLKGALDADPLVSRLFYEKFNCSFEEAVQANMDEKKFQDFYLEQLRRMMSMAGASLPEMSDDSLIELMRTKSETIFYKVTVMNVSGPLVIKSLLDSWAQTTHAYRTYSLEHYGLDAHFKSGQQVKFNTSMEELVLLFQSKQGFKCDKSWMREGQTAIKEHEKLMNSSAALIQMRYREYMQKKRAKQEMPEKELVYRMRRTI